MSAGQQKRRAEIPATWFTYFSCQPVLTVAKGEFLHPVLVTWLLAIVVGCPSLCILYHLRQPPRYVLARLPFFAASVALQKMRLANDGPLALAIQDPARAVLGLTARASQRLRPNAISDRVAKS